MYETAASMIGRLSVEPAFQEGLYTPERHLFYLAMETFIYEYRKSIGMLSAYAEPFYPPMEEKIHKKDIIKESPAQNNDTEQTTNITIQKANKAETPESTKETVSIHENKNVIEEEWVQVKSNAKTNVVREVEKQAYNKNVENRYAELKEDEEGAEEIDDTKKLSVDKKEAKVQHKTNNVNDITVDETEKHMNDYIKKYGKAIAKKKTRNEIKSSSVDYKTLSTPSVKNDVNAKVPEGKRNEKLNSIDLYKTLSKSSVKTKEETVKNITGENDSKNEEDTDDDDSIKDEDKLMIDNVDSEDSSTIGSTNKESKDDINVGEKKSEQIERIRYQKDVLLFRLEQAEETEKHLKKELQVSKEEASKEERKYVNKIAALESVLKKKTELLLNTLRKKGQVIQCVK